jgi:hypothetical protein
MTRPTRAHGPALANLGLPPYAFASDTKVKIG